MPVDVHHSGPQAHREPAKKSLEDQEILGHGCGIYPRISRALRLIRGVGGTRGRLSESDPTWAVNGVTRHRTRRGSTWVDHVRSKWHVTRTGVTWDFRGGGRMTCRGKSRGDGWDRYMETLQLLKFSLKKERLNFMNGWSTSEAAMLGVSQPTDLLGSLFVDNPDNVMDKILNLFSCYD